MMSVAYPRSPAQPRPNGPGPEAAPSSAPQEHRVQPPPPRPVPQPSQHLPVAAPPAPAPVNPPIPAPVALPLPLTPSVIPAGIVAPAVPEFWGHSHWEANSLVQEVQYQKVLLDQAHAEISRLRGSEAQLVAVQSELEYLRGQTIQLRQLEDYMRNQIQLQESNIDAYSQQTHAFYATANAEVSSLQQLTHRQQVELSQLSANHSQAVAEVNRSHEQIRLAEAEAARLRNQLQGALQFRSEAQFLRQELQTATAQLTAETQRYRVAAASLDRLARENSQLRSRLQQAIHDVERFDGLYKRTVLDLGQFKVALAAESSAHNYARGQLSQQAQKAKFAVTELERLAISGDQTRAIASTQLSEAEAEILHLRRIITQYQAELDRLRSSFEAVHFQPELLASPGGLKKFAFFGLEVAEGAELVHPESEENLAVRIVKVGGPCELAGLLAGDLITSINGKRIASLDDFNTVVSDIEPFTEVKIIFERDGKLLGTDVITGETVKQPGLPGRFVETD